MGSLSNSDESIMDDEGTPKTVEEYLNEISYEVDPNYVPSDFALQFIIFIKLVEGGNPENKSPVVHYYIIDNFVAEDDKDVINMCHRGIAKSTLKEYLILYLAVFNILPSFGEVRYAIYVSDSIENGVKKMRNSLQYRRENSSFLMEALPKVRFTDMRWEFHNKEGKHFVVTGHGAQTGVRGTREKNRRPVLALLDDLISDTDARSTTVIAQVEDTVYKAVDYALHPQRRKIIWSGTPFNARDPLYKAVGSGAWRVNVYPVCEAFPCSRENFRGSWEERFSYDYVLKQYKKAVRMNNLSSFNQELMLRIMSEEDRLIQDSDIVWYERKFVMDNRGAYNFYITTDFATSEKSSSDFSVISVWALNSNGDWLWIDGICKKQLMDKNIVDLFRLAQMYNPQEVGVEVSGQQYGFISWIKTEMGTRNCYFNLASDGNSNKPGIRPTTDKMQRFNIVLPWFKSRKIWFPEELKNETCMLECMQELTLIAAGGFKSKHDDFIDTISMLGSLRSWRPSQSIKSSINDKNSVIWDEDMKDESSDYDSYIP